ncbi:MAG: ETC complex I subunit [Pseudomonadota bacterium]|nr:ETC complex I subunit [Pseudomonadota bacterium]
MPKARIYRPDKSAMQSGKGPMKEWVLEFAPEKPVFVDALMGWAGSADMKSEIHLFFPTREAAVAYAKRQRIPYEIYLPNQRREVRKAYADNFKYGKIKG